MPHAVFVSSTSVFFSEQNSQLSGIDRWKRLWEELKLLSITSRPGSPSVFIVSFLLRLTFQEIRTGWKVGDCFHWTGWRWISIQWRRIRAFCFEDVFQGFVLVCATQWKNTFEKRFWVQADESIEASLKFLVFARTSFGKAIVLILLRLLRFCSNRQNMQ